MNNRQWGAESLFVRLRCIPLMVIVMVIMGIFAYPSMADDNVYDVPKGATQAWIDVESFKTSEAGIRGTFNGAAVTFKPSPSGVTAVVNVSAIQGRRAALQLQASGDVKALVAVTFADQNNVVVVKYASRVVITQTLATVEPGQPVKPVVNRTDNNNNGGDLSRSGVSILGLVFVAVLIAAAGLAFIMLRRGNAKLTADEEDVQ